MSYLRLTIMTIRHIMVSISERIGDNEGKEEEKDRMKKCFLLLLCFALIWTMFGCTTDSGDQTVSNNGANRFQNSGSNTATNNQTSLNQNANNKQEDQLSIEKVENDLRNNNTHECLAKGTVTYSSKNQTNYASSSSTQSWVETYYFDIIVTGTYGNEKYRASVSYSVTHSDRTDDTTYNLKERDIWQVSSEFTRMGTWVYQDANTDIWVRFISHDGLGYEVEYEISYYHSSWTNSGEVSLSSNGPTYVTGSSAWDGERTYLGIDLEIYDESEGRIDAGYIKVYLNEGVYWDRLHAKGGPFKLHN